MVLLYLDGVNETWGRFFCLAFVDKVRSENRPHASLAKEC